MAKKREKIVEKIDEKINDITEEVKKEVKEEFKLNVPNSITLFRIVFVFIFIYMLFKDYSKIALAIVFGIAAFTDWLDGFFARKLHQTTTIGARMDQVIDRVFTIMVVGSLIAYFFFHPVPNFNILFLFLVTSREIVALPGFLINLIRNKDPYKVRYIGKVTTFIQSFALGAIILGVSWSVYLVIPTCIIGIIAGFDYLRYSFS